VFVAVAVVSSSAIVNHEVSKRLATLPLPTTTSAAPPTTVAVVRNPAPQTSRLPRTQKQPDPVVAIAETTTTAVTMAQEVPQSAYDIITKLDALPVRDEHALGYARYRYGAWRDDDANGCSSYYDTLIDQGTGVVHRTNPCDIVSGEWHSLYDDVLVQDPDAVGVDHVVGLYESWKSGAYAWTDAQRNDYLNDVKLVHAAMLAVSRQSQSNKAGRDPKDWMPSNQAFRCQYLQTWVDVKTAWNLSVDAGERESIAAAALNC
jgi:hypothetical protein